MRIHITQQSDTLWKISERYDVPLQKLMNANPQIRDPNKLARGTKVWIPTGRVSLSSSNKVEEREQLRDRQMQGVTEEGLLKEEQASHLEEYRSVEKGGESPLASGKAIQAETPGSLLPPMPIPQRGGCGEFPKSPYLDSPSPVQVPHMPIPPVGIPVIPRVPHPIAGIPFTPYGPMNFYPPYPYWGSYPYPMTPIDWGGTPPWDYRFTGASSSLSSESSSSLKSSSMWESSSSGES